MLLAVICTGLIILVAGIVCKGNTMYNSDVAWPQYQFHMVIFQHSSRRYCNGDHAPFRPLRLMELLILSGPK